MRNIFLAISLANLCLFRILGWQLSYFGSPPFGVNLLAWMLDVLLLALLFWAAAFLTVKYGGKYGLFLTRAGFLLLTGVILKNLYRHFFGPLSLRTLNDLFGKVLVIGFICVIAALVIFILIKRFEDVVRFARFLVLILAPFAFILFAQTTWMMFGTDFTPPAGNIPFQGTDQIPEIKKRVVWIVFDELDYHLAFVKRPKSLKLPELERFSDESFFAANAYSPSGQTLTSMPALTTGRLVADTYEKSQSDLHLRFAGGDRFISWKTENVFTEVSKMGGTSAVVGWYHPYCRVFRGVLKKCTTDYSFFFNRLSGQHEDNLAESMISYLRRFGASVPVFKDFLELFADERSKNRSFIRTIDNLSSDADKYSIDKDLSLVLLHYPIPHSPYIYDRKTEGLVEKGKVNYFDNLALADKILGDLREKMERTGIWDGTTVVISSDHWWRKDFSHIADLWTEEEAAIVAAENDFRVPFIVKPAKDGQTNGGRLDYGKEFNTVLTHGLVLALLRGEVSGVRDIADWIDGHRSGGKSPY